MRTLRSVTAQGNNVDGAEDVARRIFAAVERHDVSIPLRLWNGAELGRVDAGYRLVLRHPWSLRALLEPRSDLAAGEAYVRDDIDVEGSMVAALGDAVRLQRASGFGWIERAGVLRDLLALPKPPESASSRRARLTSALHSKERDAQAIRFHYDVSNAFYQLFLDRQLVYSCGYFSEADAKRDDPAALDRAQLRKLDLVCRKLRLRPGDRLLDIGCGWGSLVLHAARRYGVEAVGITLSEQQASLARKRVAGAGLGDRVDIRLEDYRDVTGTFDAVASIGMFEHVGESQFETYFARAYERTAPGGRFLNHAITTGGRDLIRDLSTDETSFAGHHVFPDGALAPAYVAVRLMEQAGFELFDVQQLRRHYARTLRHWVANLERNAERARELGGEAVYRTWRAYMAGSALGFDANDLGVVQVLGVKGNADLPFGRDWMEPGERES